MAEKNKQLTYEVMYTGGVLLFPVIMFFKQQLLLSVVLIPAAIALFYYDKTFKKLKAKYPGFERFNIIAFLSGLALACVSFIWTDVEIFLSLAWIIVTTLKSLKYS